MLPRKYRPLLLQDFERILNSFEIVNRLTKGGHVVLTVRKGEKNITIIYQTHVNPVPLRVVKNTIKALEIRPEEFYARLEKKP